VIIAKQEQEIGNYRQAHKLLFETHKDLESHRIPITLDLRRNLMLLHSYVIVRIIANLGDHETAARMLIRVAKNISKFPKHVVQILTSAVLECQRVGFSGSAYEYASILVRPEYRMQINEKYKKKIEGTVRKRSKDELVDPPEQSSPCPFCSAMVPDTHLECDNCKQTIPYCIATGRHLVLTDWSFCPSCHFPALYSAFVKLVKAEGTCPMCEQSVQEAAIKHIKNPDPRQLGEAFEQEKESGSTDGVPESPTNGAVTAAPPSDGLPKKP